MCFSLRLFHDHVIHVHGAMNALDANEFDVLLTPSASHVSSLDNMGAVITVFEFE